MTSPIGWVISRLFKHSPEPQSSPPQRPCRRSLWWPAPPGHKATRPGQSAVRTGEHGAAGAVLKRVVTMTMGRRVPEKRQNGRHRNARSGEKRSALVTSGLERSGTGACARISVPSRGAARTWTCPNRRPLRGFLFRGARPRTRDRISEDEISARHWNFHLSRALGIVSAIVWSMTGR